MNSKYVLVVLAVLILAEGLYFYFFQYSPDQEISEKPKQEEKTPEEKEGDKASESNKTTVSKEVAGIEADFSEEIEGLDSEIKDLDEIADDESLNTIDSDLGEMESLE